MLSTGEALTASQAVEIGLATGPFKAAELIEVAVRSFTPVPEEPVAVREGRLVMEAGTELPLHEGVALETEAFLRLAGSPESK
ncbi:hypothetical protein ABTO49_21315, partial [Acinetobacter baumannii]